MLSEEHRVGSGNWPRKQKLCVLQRLLKELRRLRLIEWKRGQRENAYRVLEPDWQFIATQTGVPLTDPDATKKLQRKRQSRCNQKVATDATKKLQLGSAYKVLEHLEEKSPHTPLGICASDDARVGGSALSKTRDHPEWFEQWWAIYWRKVARKPAEKAFRTHVRTKARFEQVMRAIQAQAPAMMARDPEKRPHGATWLNAERWLDEPSTPARKPPQSDVIERTKALWAKRLANGERPI